MKIKYLLIVLLGAALVAVSGCRSGAVYNVHDQNIQTNMSVEEVKKEIIGAGAALGWSMKANTPGNIVATLHLRSHMAQVNIKYSANSYSITYKDSSNLNYESAGSEYTDDDGNLQINDKSTIHSNYNGWVQNLDRQIKARLGMM